jgi:hypothetical protein
MPGSGPSLKTALGRGRESTDVDGSSPLMGEVKNAMVSAWARLRPHTPGQKRFVAIGCSPATHVQVCDCDRTEVSVTDRKTSDGVLEAVLKRCAKSHELPL